MTAIVQSPHSRSYSIFARWVAASYHHAAWVLLASLLIAVACGVYTSRNLGMNSDTTDMLSEHLPFRANYKHYKNTFPQDQDMDTLVLVLDAPTPEQAHDATKRLAERLKEDTVNIRNIYLPNGDAFFERNGLLYESIPELGRITDRLAAAQPLIAKIAGNPTLHTFATMLTEAVEALRAGRSLELDSVLGGVSATLDARLAGVPRALSWQVLFRGEAQKNSYRELMTVQPKLDYTQLSAAEQPIAALRATARDLGLTDDGSVRLRVTGDVALADEELRSAMLGTEYAGLLAVVLVAGVLYIALHTAGLILAVLLSLVLGLLLTAAFATAAVGHLNVISIAFAVLYVGLGVDYAIHFLLRYRELLEEAQPTVKALQEAGGDTGHSLFLCAITTAIGFYAFMPTAYRGVAELGLIAGTGMLISLVVTLTLAPALQRYFPTRPAAVSTGAESFLGRVLQLPLRWRKVVYVGTLAGLLAAVAVFPRIEFDYNLLNLQDQRGEAVQTFRELLAEAEHTPWHAVALADGEEEASRLTQRLTSLPEVSKVVTILDFVPTEQEEKLALIEEMALTLGPLTLPAAPSAANQYTPAQQRAALDALSVALDRFIAERPEHPALPAARSLRTSLGALLAVVDAATGTDDKNKLLHAVGKDLLALLPDAMQRLHTSIEAVPFNQQQLPKALQTRWHSQTGQYRIAIYPAENVNDNQALRRFVRAVQQEAPQATGAPVISLEAGEAVIQAFILAFSLALAGITIILLVMLRSVVFTLLVLIPLLLAALFTGAATVLLGVQFNFANIIALPLLLGIGIDSGLHMVQRSRSHGMTHEDLMHTSTTRATFYSALTTLVGFGSLAFSSHQGTASMGVLLTIGLALTLICILVILPVLLATAAQSTSS